MRMIFDGLVEEFRAWHLFEERPGSSPQRDLRDLPGMARPGIPEYERPGYGTPAYGAAGYGAAEFGTPAYGSAELGAAQYGGAEYGGPGYGGPEYDWAGRRARDTGRAPRPDGPR